MDILDRNFNDLCEVSKIRFFIASDLKKSNLENIYSSYWLDMENRYLDASQRVKENLFEKFLVDYLTIQRNAVIPQKDSLFTEFIDFYKNISKFQTKEIIIKNIFRYSMYYLRIYFADLRDDDIRKKIKLINALRAYDS